MANLGLIGGILGSAMAGAIGSALNKGSSSGKKPVSSQGSGGSSISYGSGSSSSSSGSSSGSSSSSSSSSSSFSPSVDYSDLINDAVSRGDYESAAKYEQLRNDKINAGYGGGYGTTNNWSQYLPSGSSSSSTPSFDSSFTSSDTPLWLQQAQANSAAWHTASPEERLQLEEANRRLYGSHGYTYDNGTWYAPSEYTQNLRGQYGITDSYSNAVDYGDLLNSPSFLTNASSEDIMNAINMRQYKSLTEPGMQQYYNDQIIAQAMQAYNNVKAIEDEAQAQIDAQAEREAQLQAYYDAMAAQIAQQYDAILPTVNQNYDDLARQAYISNRMAQRDLPGQLSAAGLGGQGAAESSIVAQNNAYTAALMQNELARQNALQEIANNRASALAGNATSAAQSMVELGTQLANERAQILAQQEQQRQNLIGNLMNYGNMFGSFGGNPTLSAQEMAYNQAYNNAMLEMNQQAQQSDQQAQNRNYWLQLWQGMGTRGATAEIAAALGIPVGAVYGKGTYSPDYI